MPLYKYRDSKGNAVVLFRKWSSWLGRIFKKLPEITRYQHFHVRADTPGEITVKESVEADEKRFALLVKKGMARLDKRLLKGPPVHSPKVLSPRRQWYLYEMIRPHIPTDADRESTAPKPKVPKPKSKTKQADA